MEQEKEPSSSIEDLFKKMRDFNVWQPDEVKKTKIKNDTVIFEDYVPEEVSYEPLRLLIDERREELEKIFAQHPDGSQVQHLLRLQNFCWVSPRLFGHNNPVVKESDPVVLLHPKPKGGLKKDDGFYLEATFLHTDPIERTQLPLTLLCGYDENVLYAKMIPGTHKCVTSSERSKKYLFKVGNNFARVSELPVYRIAVDTNSVAWTSLDKNFRLRLAIWESEKEDKELFDEEICSEAINLPFAWRKVPNRATVVARGGNMIHLSCYEMGFLNKLRETESHKHAVGHERIVDVVVVPQQDQFALFTESHVNLVRYNAAKQFSWVKAIKLPIRPSQLSFSPDAKNLAVAGVRQNDEGKNTHHLHVIDMNTSQETENMANNFSLNEIHPERPAIKVTVLNDGTLHGSWEIKLPTVSGSSPYRTEEQLLLPIDFKALLVLKAIQQVCIHQALVGCAQRCLKKDTTSFAKLFAAKCAYLDAIERSTTFKECSHLWQTVFKSVLSEERSGLALSSDTKSDDITFIHPKKQTRGKTSAFSGVHRLMRKMAQEVIELDKKRVSESK
jgi:hypothetical protein